MKLIFIFKVKQAANEVVPGLMIETCGSYRRLKSSCGDIDLLITFKDGRRHIHETVLAPLINKLKEIGKRKKEIIERKCFFFQRFSY
jgi:DNA polymerase lambda